MSDKDLYTIEYKKKMWEKIREKYLTSKFGGQNRNVEMSWKILNNKMLKAKLMIQVYIEVNPPFFNSVKYQVFIIFTIYIAALLYIHSDFPSKNNLLT